MAAGDVDVAVTQPSAVSCAFFDGVDDAIELAANALFGSFSSFSISAWVKPRTFAAEGTTARIFGKGGQPFLLSMTQTTGTVGIDNTGLSDNSFTSNGSLTLNVWNNIIVTYDGANKKIYLNGTLDRTEVATGTTNANSATIGIGANDSGGFNAFPGFIRDVRLYNRALSESEITRVANSELITDGLVGHWKLDGDANDSVGGNNGTVTGAVFVTDSDKIDTTITTQRSTVGTISGSWLIADVMNGSQIITAGIQNA